MAPRTDKIRAMLSPVSRILLVVVTREELFERRRRRTAAQVPRSIVAGHGEVLPVSGPPTILD